MRPAPDSRWKCCSTPHSYANSILPIADVCHGHLHLGRNQLPHMHRLLFKDDPHPTSSIGQSNTVKVVSLLKEMFWEHGIPQELCSENGPQYVSAQFTEFCTSWGITHKTSSPHYPQLNGFTVVCVKPVKHALQCAKYSGTDPQLTLLVLQATPIDAKLPSPAELLYWCQIRTTIPARICNTNLAALKIHEWIDARSVAFKSQADKWCKSLAPLYAGQPVAMYNTLHKIWIPATVLCVLPKDSYQVCTSNGMVYCHTRWHLHECSVKPNDTTPAVTPALLQAPARPHISAPAKPAQLPQPPSVAPTTPVTTKPQTPAVSEVTPESAPTSATPSVAPVQPCTSGHACTTPKHLIQEL